MAAIDKLCTFASDNQFEEILSKHFLAHNSKMAEAEALEFIHASRKWGTRYKMACLLPTGITRNKEAIAALSFNRAPDNSDTAATRERLALKFLSENASTVTPNDLLNLLRVFSYDDLDIAKDPEIEAVQRAKFVSQIPVERFSPKEIKRIARALTKKERNHFTQRYAQQFPAASSLQELMSVVELLDEKKQLGFAKQRVSLPSLSTNEVTQLARTMKRVKDYNAVLVLYARELKRPLDGTEKASLINLATDRITKADIEKALSGDTR